MAPCLAHTADPSDPRKWLTVQKWPKRSSARSAEPSQYGQGHRVRIEESDGP